MFTTKHFYYTKLLIHLQQLASIHFFYCDVNLFIICDYYYNLLRILIIFRNASFGMIVRKQKISEIRFFCVG